MATLEELEKRIEALEDMRAIERLQAMRKIGRGCALV